MAADDLRGHTRIQQQMNTVLSLEAIFSLLKELEDPLINSLSDLMNSVMVLFL